MEEVREPGPSGAILASPGDYAAPAEMALPKFLTHKITGINTTIAFYATHFWR